MEPPSTGIEIGAAEIGAATAPPTEIEIGDLIARAAVLICVGMEKYRAGQSTLSISMQVSELIARLYALQAAPDFATTVIREGRRALPRALAQDIAAAVALCPRGDMDPVLDEILSWPLGVLARVTEAERQFAS